jgi:predicted NBD/HSP70 family sugar kinase
MRGGYIAGIDLGATNVRIAVADQDGNIEARRHFPLPQGEPAAVIEKLTRTVDDLARGVWVGATVDAIGIALPGLVDPDAGLVASVANIPGWDDIPLAKLLAGERRIPIAMENDANAAAVGEGWLGAARGMRHHVFLALGTGIGGGVVIDGRLHRGAHFLAGEVAFSPATREQARVGGWDHNLEALVGGRAIAVRAAEILGDGAKPADLFDAARAGKPQAAADWLAETQEYLAMATASIIALLDPDAVVFGGGVIAAQGAWFLDPIRELAHRSTPTKTPILQSQLGEDAQILGAIKLALDKEGVVRA